MNHAVSDRAPGWRWWTETAIIAVLGVAAVVGPVALGGTPTRVRCGLELVLAAAAVLWIIVRPRSGWSAWIPVAAGAAVALQLIPMPLWLLAWIAPSSMLAWSGVGERLGVVWATISVDPGATAEGMRRAFLGCAAIVIVADLCRDGWRRWGLAGAIAMSGAIIWGAGLAYPRNREYLVLGRFSIRAPDIWHATSVLPPVRTAAFSTESAYATVGRSRYFVQRWGVGDGTGCYVVSNNFAAGMYLTIPMLLAVCRACCRGPSWGWLGALASILAFAAACWTVGVQAGSRAGAGATALAGIVFMLMSSETVWSRRAWLCALVVACCALVGFILVFFHVTTWPADILPADVRQRMVESLSSEGRNVYARIACRVFQGSPLLGTGLGTFGFTQVPFVGPQHVWYFTHNDYAQLLSEAGIVGASCLVAALVVLVVALSRVRGLPATDRTLAAGAWSSLAGIGLHSLFDWNMHLPANALLTCLALGLALAVASASSLTLACTPREADGRISPTRTAATTAEAWSLWHACTAVVFASLCIVTACLSVRDARTENIRLQLRHALVAARTAKTESEWADAAARLRRDVSLARAAHLHHVTDSELPMLVGQALLHLEARDEGLAGDDATAWFDRARRCNPLRLGSAEPSPN